MTNNSVLIWPPVPHIIVVSILRTKPHLSTRSEAIYKDTQSQMTNFNDVLYKDTQSQMTNFNDVLYKDI